MSPVLRKPLVERLEDRLLLSAGDLDVVFAGGKATANFSLGQSQVQALAVEADGRIVAVGQAGSNGSATSVAVAPDGKIIVAGSVQPSPFSSASDFTLVRYNADGSLDTTFGTNGIVTTKLGDFDAAANTVLIVPDGNTATNPADYKILAAGHTSTSGGNFNFALVRYNFNGSLDTTFHTTG